MVSLSNGNVGQVEASAIVGTALVTRHSITQMPPDAMYTVHGRNVDHDAMPGNKRATIDLDVGTSGATSWERIRASKADAWNGMQESSGPGNTFR